MGLELRRLDLGSVEVDGTRWPVHGFVVMHPRGAILVDSGMGGPDRLLADWRCVNRGMADALADHDLVPSDIVAVVNTHLHFDHCGQNPVFGHAPFFIQRVELERARRDSVPLLQWFDFMGARFELLDGDAEIADGVRVLATPGHTSGHQSVVVDGDGEELLVGDAVYQPAIWRRPESGLSVTGQAAEPVAWRASVDRLQARNARHVHFCHHTGAIHG